MLNIKNYLSILKYTLLASLAVMPIVTLFVIRHQVNKSVIISPSDSAAADYIDSHDSAAFSIRNSQPVTALKFASLALAKADSIKNENLRKRNSARSMNIIGQILAIQCKYNDALDTLNNALGIYKSIDDQDNANVIEGILNVNTSISIIFRDTKNYAKAKNYASITLAIDSANQDVANLIADYLDIGDIDNMNGQYDSALIYTNMALALFNQAKQDQNEMDTSVIKALIFNNLGNVYHNISRQDTCCPKSCYDSLIKSYYSQAIIADSSQEDMDTYSESLLGLANCYKKGYDRSCLLFADSALKEAEKIGNNFRKIEASELISDFYYHNKNIDSVYLCQKNAIEQLSLFNNVLVKVEEPSQKLQDLEQRQKEETDEHDHTKILTIVAIPILLIIIIVSVLYINKHYGKGRINQNKEKPWWLLPAITVFIILSYEVIKLPLEEWVSNYMNNFELLKAIPLAWKKSLAIFSLGIATGIFIELTKKYLIKRHIIPED